MSTDPLLKALAHRDPACPDGQALVRLGELARAAGASRPTDLRLRVRAALAAELADDQPLAADDAERVGALVRSVRPPRPVDLRARVRAALAPRSLRLTPEQAARHGRRWRLWLAVAAAHVVALLLITAALRQGDPADATRTAAPRPVEGTGGIQAESWQRLQVLGGDVLAPRRDAQRRESLRTTAGMANSAVAVGRLTAWLATHQDPATGRFVAELDSDRAVAVQSFAVLALLGEGEGDGTRLAAARRGLGPIAAALAGVRSLGGTALSAATLAVVEGAVLLDDAGLRHHAAAALVRLTREMPGRPGEAGLNGLGWLAIEVAAVGGIDLPSRALDEARRRLAREMPATADIGRIGLAAYARLINGQREATSTRELLASLAASPPAADTEGRIDALSWFLAALAMREGGGEGWARWAAQLQALIAERMVVDGTATAHLSARTVRHADSDVLATALAALVLQTPYRYQPLAR